MKEKEKSKINEDMEDVISTSRKVRDFLLNETISAEEKSQELANVRLVLEANKNIVASSNVKINVDRLNNGK